ncbi:MAG: FecR domain-containing protein [Burkholderiales bacterium]|nr:FecR domain-containing protein [Burkholderiales bacterium]
MNTLPRSAQASRTGCSVAPLTAGLCRLAAAAIAALALVAGTALAQAAGDLPGRVGRVADLAGELFLAAQDKPDAWAAVGINYPVASGDNLWLGGDGRAEVDFGGGQFRFAGDTSLHVSQLDDTHFSLFVAQGRVSVRVRGLEPGDVATIDTPNAQIAITRPGLYRIEVTDDRQHTVVIVREGEVNVQTQAAVQQVLPGQAAYVEGADPQFANVQNGIGQDGFDAWVASRDRLYRTRGNAYVSPQMVGAADLDRYGTWQESPQYGAVWYPSDVAADWAPYRNGYWVNVGTWGPTWVDFAPWGYAPFHYGRWAFIGGRWGWCPGAFTPRPLWAPALVAWTGGAGWTLSVSAGAPVYGWIPLGWGEPFRPWWGHCSAGCWDRFNRPVAVNVTVVRPWSPPPTHWRNASVPGGITAVPFRSFESREPVARNMVRVPRDVVAVAPVLASPPVMRNDVVRAGVGRSPAAPPPASSLQPAFARPLPTAPMGAAPASPPGAAAGPDGARGRVGSAGPAGAVPPAAGTAGSGVVPRAAPGVAAPVPSTGRPPSANPRSAESPSSTSREPRVGMPTPSSVTSQQPGSRAPSPMTSPGSSAPPAARMAPAGSSTAPPARVLEAPTSPGSMAAPPMRAQPPQAPPSSPGPRAQPQTVAPPTMRAPQHEAAPPAIRPSPSPVPPAAPAQRGPAPVSPQQAAPMRSLPQAAPAPHSAPAARPAPAPRAAPESSGGDAARQGTDAGNAVRGERGRER